MPALDALLVTTDLLPVFARTQGVETLCRALRGAGARVSIVCACDEEVTRRPPGVVENAGGGFVARIPVPGPRRASSAMVVDAFADRAAALARRLGVRAHAVHAHDALAIPAARTLRELTGASRLVLTLHDHSFETPYYGSSSKPEQARSIRDAVQEATSLIAPSRTVRDILRRKYGASRATIDVLPCPPAFERPPVPEPKLRARFARGDEKLVLFVGHPSPLSGVRELARAIACDSARRRRIRCVLVGGIDEMEDFFELPAPQELGNLTFLPRLERDDLVRFYAIADAGVVPSLVAPSALVATEMIAARLPIVYTDTQAHREVLGSLSSRSVVAIPVQSAKPPTLDPAVLRHALFRQVAASDSAARRRLRDLARAHVVDAMPRDRFVRGHLRAYGRSAHP
jgi:glycosyltransferase involved in cell wall biosynthesis